MTKEERLKLIALASKMLKHYAPPSSFLEFNNLLPAEIILINDDEQSKQAADLISTEIFRTTGKKPLVKKEYFANFLTSYENRNFLVSCDYNADFFRKNKFEKKTIIIASRKVQQKMIYEYRTEMKEFPFQILSLEQVLESKYQKLKKAMSTRECIPDADIPKFKDLTPEGLLGENFKISLKRAASIMFLADDYDALAETAAIFLGERCLKEERPKVVCLDNIECYHDEMLEKIERAAYTMKIYHEYFFLERVENSQITFDENNIIRKILHCYVKGQNNIIVLSAIKSTLVKKLEQAIDDAGLSRNDFSFCIINSALQNLTMRQEYRLLAQVYRLRRENPALAEPADWDNFEELARKFCFVQPGKYKKMWYNYLEYSRGGSQLIQILQNHKVFINKL